MKPMQLTKENNWSIEKGIWKRAFEDKTGGGEVLKNKIEAIKSSGKVVEDIEAVPELQENANAKFENVLISNQEKVNRIENEQVLSAEEQKQSEQLKHPMKLHR